MMKSLAALAVLSSIFVPICLADDAPTLSPIVVTADPLGTQSLDLPSSVTVIAAPDYDGSGGSSLADSLSFVPDLTFAGGTNTPRFFQIRGIGELEQYEGAPASSVGLLVDDFDFTGIGSVVQTFDADQVEILRGPQGMAFGQNALAGLMHVKLADPAPEFSGKGKVVLGSDDLSGGGLSIGGPLDGTSKNVLFHLSAYHEYEDGFRRNKFTGTDSTNRRDQFTGIAKLEVLASPDTTIDLSFLRADTDNGYDAFAIDNSFTTHSDRPGKDAQGSTAAALKVTSKLTKDIALTSISSLTNSLIHYSFDGDWGNNPFWGVNAPYDFFSDTRRDRDQAFQEIRLSSPEGRYRIGEDSRWLFGLYGQRLTEGSLIRNDEDGVPYDILDSDFSSRTAAVFGQVETPLFAKTAGTAGIRIERKAAEYEDSRLTDEAPEDTMIGGNASVQRQLSDSSMGYLLVSRGYKAGGVNTGIAVPSTLRTFGPESLWNAETGLKGDFKEIGLRTNAALFYQLRREQQVKLSLQNDPDDPLSFTFLTDNAARGRNYGAEWDASLSATDRLSLEGALSLLESRYTTSDPIAGTGKSRAASYAPVWQYAIGPKYRFTERLFIKLQAYGKSGYYYDDSFDIKSKPYSIVNLSLGYDAANWSWSLWVKNLLDKRYAVRGFYFGNEPPDFPNKLYKQLGDPIQVGTSLTFYF